MAKVKTKKFYNSKTFWVAVTTIVGGIAAYFTGEQQLQEVIITMVGAIFLALRSVTNTQII